MQQELKNCPFCGGTELTYINHRRCIRCKSCDAEGPYEPTGTEDNLWNTRADKAVPDLLRVIELAEDALMAVNEKSHFVPARVQIVLDEIKKLKGE